MSLSQRLKDIERDSNIVLDEETLNVIRHLIAGELANIRGSVRALNKLLDNETKSKRLTDKHKLNVGNHIDIIARDSSSITDLIKEDEVD